MPVEELPQVLSLPFRHGPVVGHGVGDPLEVHHAHVGREMKGGHVVFLCDDIHEPEEGRLAAEKGLVIDVDVLDEHRVEVHQRVQVAEDDPVHHHEDVVGHVGPLAEGVRIGEQERGIPPDGPYAEFGDDFDDDLAEGREAGIVVQMISFAGDGGEQEVLPVRHEGREGVDAERLFSPQGRFPGGEIRPLRRTQAEFRQGAQLRVQERAFEVDVSFLPVQLEDLAHDFPVAVDVGREEAEAVIPLGLADVQVGGGTGRRQHGEGEVFLPSQDRPPEPGGDYFSVALHMDRSFQAGEPGRTGLEETARGLGLVGGKEVVLVEDREADGGVFSPVVQVQDRGRSFGNADTRGNLQRAFGRHGSGPEGLIAIFRDDFHPVRHPGPGRAVEDGQETGAGQPGRSGLGRIDRRVGDEPVGAGGRGRRNPERSGAPAAQQADFGRTGRSVLRDEFHIGNGAFVRKTAVSVQAGQGAPDRIAGQIDLPVGGDVNPFHRRRLGEYPGERQEQGRYLFHSLWSQKSGFFLVPPAATQS